ncbi:MAG: MASE3 domain-containing protein [Myxococcota bacterium]
MVVLPALLLLVPRFELPHYHAIHTLMESFAVLVAALIWAVAWNAAAPGRAPAMAQLGAGFLAVALLDLGHLLSYQGMPDLVTPSSPAKGIWFWLAARLAAALTLLSFVTNRNRLNRGLLLTASVGGAALTTLALLFFEKSLPAVFLSDSGLTVFKVGVEVVVVLLTLGALVAFVRKPPPGLLINHELLALAMVAMAASELPFCLYARVTDLFNVVGHVEKVFAYALLYRAVFLEVVREPYLLLERSAKALEQSEARIRLIAETIDEVVFLKGARTGELLYVSPAFERVWQRPLSEAGRMADFVAPEDADSVRRFITEQATKDAAIEYRIVRPDGTPRWVRSQTRVVRDTSGAPSWVAGVARDITDEKALQAQALTSLRTESVARLASTVAHDFNNLLTVILSSVSFATEQARGNAALLDDLAQIAFAGQRAQDLTRQLLTFARRSVTRLSVFDASEVVARLVPMLSRLCPGLDVITELAPGAHPVKLDPTHLEQVVLNLVVNAREARPRDGQVRIVLRDAVESDLTRHGLSGGRWVLLAVVDQGEGMSEEVRRRALDPFFTTREDGRGSGLGLATCATIAEQAGGHLRLESALGVGTTVELLLPHEEAPAASTTGDAHLPRGHGELLLLVEDDAPVRRSAARMLKSLGYQVVEAGNGLEALGVIGAQKSLALVVTDLAMPGLDGRALANELTRQRPDLPVLFTSGFASGDAPTPLLPKPYAITELAKAVSAALQRKPPASAA